MWIKVEENLAETVRGSGCICRDDTKTWEWQEVSVTFKDQVMFSPLRPDSETVEDDVALIEVLQASLPYFWQQRWHPNIVAFGFPARTSAYLAMPTSRVAM